MPLRTRHIPAVSRDGPPAKCCYDESCTARIAKDRYDWQGGRQCVAMTGKRVRMLNLRRVLSDVAVPIWGLRKIDLCAGRTPLRSEPATSLNALDHRRAAAGNIASALGLTSDRSMDATLLPSLSVFSDWSVNPCL